jgi:hypothetical protein
MDWQLVEAESHDRKADDHVMHTLEGFNQKRNVTSAVAF